MSRTDDGGTKSNGPKVEKSKREQTKTEEN